MNTAAQDLPKQPTSESHALRQKSRPWSSTEDQRLTWAVSQHGCRNWHKIASIVGDRTGDQCCQRWYRALSPEIIKGQWNEAEDAQLVMLVQRFGVGMWKRIAQGIPGRTDIQCRSRWIKKARRFRKIAAAAASLASGASLTATATTTATTLATATASASASATFSAQAVAVLRSCQDPHFAMSSSALPSSPGSGSGSGSGFNSGFTSGSRFVPTLSYGSQPTLSPHHSGSPVAATSPSSGARHSLHASLLNLMPHCLSEAPKIPGSLSPPAEADRIHALMDIRRLLN
eukprot:TRINITY_DN4463_c0_g1_i1.p1 TRINITY_DN4463_c0_g1~~TRINITY_DN4463_c0_g1_i1.p1  ORF type:complete len:288 (+),score=42.89 TRINITY_DN4463_c0_g1_i1:96-959(+)